MNCLKCGKEIPDDSVVCGSCGAKVKEPSKRRSTGLIVVIAALIGLFIGFGYWHEYRLPGIVINSPDEIMDELIQKIIDNDISSLTINYEFTRCAAYGKNEQYEEREKEQEQLRTNPFYRANNIKTLRRLSFEINFGSEVHSLACAFRGFDKLEYVNIKDTSGITDMNSMFLGDGAFNQPIGNCDTSKVTNMKMMFRFATSFNHPIGSWDTSSVASMEEMFEEA